MCACRHDDCYCRCWECVHVMMTVVEGVGNVYMSS
jgi:hypothetical protein